MLEDWNEKEKWTLAIGIGCNVWIVMLMLFLVVG